MSLFFLQKYDNQAQMSYTMVFKAFFKTIWTLLAILAFCQISWAQEDIDAGKALFRNNCATCHNRNMKDDLTGPALGGVQGRWNNDADLYAWIRNSSALVASGNEYAVGIYNKWNKVAMTAFPNLTDADIANLLAYVNCTFEESCPGEVVTSIGPVSPTEKGSSWPLYLTLFLVLAFLAIVLSRVITNLNRYTLAEEGQALPAQRTLWETLTSKGVISFLVFALVVLGGYTTVSRGVDLGRQQDYAPDQPIKFSHVTHAGLHKIDCQYCHDGARRSKHSVIPAANTCMNCHKAIEVGSQHGTGELSKIFASIGYNPTTDKYIPNYENMPMDEVKKIFVGWMTETYVKETGTLDSKGEQLVKDQWEALVASLTNDHKSHVAGPIEWTRIHNLPDHAYFNHAQHVSVGKVACQTCHGPVEEMEVVKQYSPLSMGWCVNCHRKTEVQFTKNDYYKSYSKMHEEIINGKREKVTVEEIGGLECQKCHY